MHLPVFQGPLVHFGEVEGPFNFGEVQQCAAVGVLSRVGTTHGDDIRGVVCSDLGSQLVEVASDVSVLRLHLDVGVGSLELFDGLVGQLSTGGVAPPRKPNLDRAVFGLVGRRAGAGYGEAQHAHGGQDCY
ncbi:hypothetical protein D3C73_1190060 [compost metagenome]